MLCAVAVMYGSNKPKESPFYAEHGKLLLYSLDKMHLAKAPIGHWSQGVAFTPDSRYMLV